MTTTPPDLHDLRDRLTARAAATPLEIAAARARLEGRLVRDARPARRGRPLLAAAVATVVLAMVSAAVVAVVHDRPGATGPAGSPGPLPISDWLFSVRPEALPADLDVVEYVRATREIQIAAVLRPGDVTSSNAFTAVVELAADPATLGVATRPAGATPVDGADAWTSPLRDTEYGVAGVQLVGTDGAGRTLRVVAKDAATARTVRAAVTFDDVHPVSFPFRVPTDWLPAGSTVSAVEFTGTQGVEVTVDVPDSPPLSLAVAAPGVFIDDGAGGRIVTAPLTAGSAVATTSAAQIVHTSSFDLRVTLGGRDGAPVDGVVSLARLRALVTGGRGVPMSLIPDASSWFPLADAVPTG